MVWAVYEYALVPVALPTTLIPCILFLTDMGHTVLSRPLSYMLHWTFVSTCRRSLLKALVLFVVYLRKLFRNLDCIALNERAISE
jgi:hypothetical protein